MRDLSVELTHTLLTCLSLTELVVLSSLLALLTVALSVNRVHTVQHIFSGMPSSLAMHCIWRALARGNAKAVSTALEVLGESMQGRASSPTHAPLSCCRADKFEFAE